MGKRLSEIASLEIINVYDGGKYGYLGDCEMTFDKQSGSILSIIVNEEKNSIFSFRSDDVIELPWINKMKVCEKTLIFDSKI
jgi:YlmC/YmxH family sporulation protein